MTKPLTARKADLVYLLFFLIHIPVMLLVDLVPLYPPFIRARFPILHQIRQYYIDTYEDRFFTSPPTWFDLYAWMEAVVHLPVSLWAVGGILRDDPMVPVVLLPFATQTAVTTATCVAEYLSWEGYTSSQKTALGWLYLPYLALAVVMMLDMFLRMKGQYHRLRTLQRGDGKKVR